MGSDVNQAPLIVSFYTLDTPYEEAARRLKASCEQFGLEHSIEGIVSRGTWQENCAFKPQFMLQKIEQFQRPILWVDADACFLQMPNWEDFAQCDLAARENSFLPKEHPSRINSGTVFVNDTETGRGILKAWIEESHQRISLQSEEEIWDQAMLRNVLFHRGCVGFKPLPWKYVKMTDFDEGMIPKQETVIEHYLASRRHKTWNMNDIGVKRRRERIENHEAFIDSLGIAAVISYLPQRRQKILECIQAVRPFVRQVIITCTLLQESERVFLQRLAKLFPDYVFLEVTTSPLAAATIFVHPTMKRVLFLEGTELLDQERLMIWLYEEANLERAATCLGEKQHPLLITVDQLALPVLSSISTRDELEKTIPDLASLSDSMLENKKRFGEIDWMLHPAMSTLISSTPKNYRQLNEQQMNALWLAKTLST